MSTPVTPPLQCPHLHLDKVRVGDWPLYRCSALASGAAGVYVRVGDWPLYRCSACERLFPVTTPLETHVIEPVPHA